jgi:hypothetical protein
MARVLALLVIFQSCTNVLIHVLVRKIHALFLLSKKSIDVVHSEFRREWYVVMVSAWQTERGIEYPPWVDKCGRLYAS